MRNHRLWEWRKHMQYERLCAKAAYAEASAAEFAELVDHMSGCIECRALFQDLVEIVADDLPQIARLHGRAAPLGGNGHIRSTAVPVPINQTNVEAHGVTRPWRRLFAWGVPVALAILLIVVYLGRQASHLRTSPPVTVVMHSSGAGGDSKQVENAELQEQVKAAQRQVKNLESLLQTTKEATAGAQNKNSQLTARVEAYEKAIAENQQIIQKQNSELEHLRQNLASANSMTAAGRIAENVAEADLSRTRIQLAAVSEQLNKQQQTNNTLKRVQELMAARDLHVISVPPMEPAVQTSRPSGRILYAEGKQAMFYGFDLTDSGQVANATFHVWGEDLESRKSIKNLGVFELDDRHTGLWVLTLNDSNVLAHVDKIFVTVEAGREALSHPHGKTILIADFRDKPQHP